MASSQWNGQCWACGYPFADFYKLDGICGAMCQLCGWNWDGIRGDHRPQDRTLAVARAFVHRIVALLSTEYGPSLLQFLTERWTGDIDSLERYLSEIDPRLVDQREAYATSP